VLLVVQTRQCTYLLGAWCPKQNCSSFRCHGTCRLPGGEIRCHSEFGPDLSAGKVLIKYSGWSNIRMRRWNGSEVRIYRALTGPRTRRKRAPCPLTVRLLEWKSKFSTVGYFELCIYGSFHTFFLELILILTTNSSLSVPTPLSLPLIFPFPPLKPKDPCSKSNQRSHPLRNQFMNGLPSMIVIPPKTTSPI
jgi:hypothetical protein